MPRYSYNKIIIVIIIIIIIISSIIIVIIVTDISIILEFLSAPFVHPAALLPFYLLFNMS